jgi:hypothetical protein
VGGQRHAPAALPLEKTRYPLYRRLVGHQSRPGQVRKISPPPRFDPRTVQPVARRYTDYPGSVLPWDNKRKWRASSALCKWPQRLLGTLRKKELQNCASCRRRPLWYDNQKVFLRIFVKFYVGLMYQNLSTPSHFGLKLTKITATLLEDLLARISARIAEVTRQTK